MCAFCISRHVNAAEHPQQSDLFIIASRFVLPGVLIAGAAVDVRQRAQKLLAEARSTVDLPALAAGDAVLMPHTSLSNTFICQPQQQNMHGRVFGGFLMRYFADS